MKKIKLIAVISIVALLVLFLANRRTGAPAENTLLPVVKSPSPSPEILRQIARVEAPSADDSKYCAFVRYARARIPSLTDREKQVLDRNYRNYLEQRQQLELSLLKREVVDQKTVLITIPAYFDKGLALYSELGDHVIAELGRARGAEIMTALDGSIRAGNGQLGMAEQSILIEDRGSLIHIVHGTDGSVMVNSQMYPTKGVFISDVVRSDPLKYSYLKPLFPDSNTTTNTAN